MDEIADRAVSEQPRLNSSADRVRTQAAHLQGRMEELTRKAKAISAAAGGSGSGSGAAGLSVLDTVYGGRVAGEDEKAREAERLENEETFRRGAEELAAAEDKKASLLEEAAARRADLARQQREVDLLEEEQRVAAAAAAALATEETGSGSGLGLGSDAGRRAEASRETENLVGVTGMSESQLEACVREEEALVNRSADIRDWYASTLANVELLGGVRLSHRLLFGTGGNDGGGAGGEVAGMELMLDLGAGQMMEVTVSAADGGVSSVQLCHGQSTAAAAEATPGARGGDGGGVSPSELEELRRTADTLPPPQNLRTLVREALSRARCAAARGEHVRLMRRRYLTSYDPTMRELMVTMPAGMVACVRLHVDYPKVGRASRAEPTVFLDSFLCAVLLGGEAGRYCI